MSEDLYSMVETLKYRGVVKQLYSGTVTTSGNSHGSNEVDVLGFKEATLFLIVSDHQGGAGKSVTVTVETKHPGGALYEDLSAFTAVTAATGQEKKAVSANLGEKLSLKWVLHADTTSVTFSVHAVLKIA